MKKVYGRISRQEVEAAVPGLEWDQPKPSDRWWRAWRFNDRHDIEIAVLFPTAKVSCWRVGLGWGKQAAFPEIQRLFPEMKEDPNGKRVECSFPDREAALKAAARYREGLEASDISVAKPTRYKTEDAGWAVKTARLIVAAVQDPDGLGPDLEKVAGRLWIDGHDDLFYAGRSLEAARRGLKLGDPGTRREHTIQCNLVRDEAVRLAQEGISISDLADFLLASIRVVLITEEEAQRMDSMRTPSGMNLRDNMPDGWKWGDDVFARLRYASIPRE